VGKTWKDILTDKATYGDDFAVSMKDGSTLTLGEMRTYDAETKGALTADLTRREQDIAKREKSVNDASIVLSTVIEKTAAANGLTPDEFINGKAPTRRQVAAANDLDEDDPLVGKLVKELKGLREELKATRGEIDTVKKNALGPMLNTYLDDYYEGKWEKLSTSMPKSAKLTREEALRYAQDNKLVDSRGRFDLSKAIKDLTYEARVQEDAERRVADLRKKDRDEAVLASVPRPGNLGAKIKTDKSLTNEKGQTKTFDEMLSDAESDTEMWKQIQGKTA